MFLIPIHLGIFLSLFVEINVVIGMQCQRCKNTDPKYFAYDHGIYYCRKCIAFGRLDVGEKPKVPQVSHVVYKKGYHLDFEMTALQKAAAEKTLTYLKQEKSVFVYAATGAGKTEMTLESISYYLSQGKKVGFAISRRQVVLEICQRLKKTFPSLSVIAVTQGYTDIVDGDLIVCTTHQLYRYPYTFDLLIMDEVDAFPYANNDLLQEIAQQACIGQFLYLSATPDAFSLEQIQTGKMEMVTLFKRPHGHPLILPVVHKGSIWIQIFWIFYYCNKWKNKQVLLFMPTKREVQLFYRFFACFYSCAYIHSASQDKDEIMAKFHQKAFRILLCTTLLERGITVPSVQVIVYRADHPVFTCASLIQIYGRVGRSFKDPEGEGVCLCQSVNPSIQDCLKQLRQMNQSV